MAHDVLRHRILLSFEAEAEGLAVTILLIPSLRLVAVP